ncbi:MAG: FKBP-type peptidyl-prolyl cis-trans isomerase [Deltaproteobacteria bacterium]|nr:FKBP-type peptidyl-prolyl cis-trans isomerase [Deltaproteobacteria bacterium]
MGNETVGGSPEGFGFFRRFFRGRSLVAFALAGLFGGCLPLRQAAAPPPAPAVADVVEKGDLVTVQMTASLVDGTVFFTSDPLVAADPKVKKADFFDKSQAKGPQELVVGSDQLFPGLQEGLLGMRGGEAKRIVVPPEQAFGASKPELIEKFPRRMEMPRILTWSAQEFTSRTGAFPVKGKEFSLNPYFPARVMAVGEKTVQLKNLARDGQTFEDDLGKTRVAVTGETIVLMLEPRIGAAFEAAGRKGRVSGSDGETFSVDFNPPLAGQEVVLDLSLVSLVKGETFRQIAIAPLEEYEAALRQARDQGKPAVVILYADRCGWCKRLLGETLEDPRVKRLSRDFVWVKINSEREASFQERFHQKGFPLVVFLKPDGTVIESREGFQDGRVLALNLKKIKANL